MGEGVGLLILDRPGHLLQKHIVHGWNNLPWHIDHTFGEDQADGGNVFLGKELIEGGERRIGGGLAFNILGQVLDNGLVLYRL